MVKERTPRQNNTLPHQQVTVEVVIPVYNEEAALSKSIPVLCAYLETYFPYRWSVVIADNASTDSTLDVARISPPRATPTSQCCTSKRKDADGP
jgi:glycosyl transferase family 2